MNKPKIRFKGFEGEWKDVKLSSIAIFSKGQGYSKSDLRENGHPIILYGRMYTKYQFAINEVDTFSNLKGAYVLSEGNEIIMPASGETSEDIACASAVLAKGIILGGDLNIVRFDLKKYSTPFLALTITYSKTHYDLSKCAQGKSVVHLHNEAISKTAVSIPSLPEQRAIASYFTSLDAQIAASTSRLSSLKQIKAASLLNMFPQKGETVPRVRFKGFQGEWKEVKLSSIAIFSKGQGYSKSDLRENGHPIILYGRMYTKYQFAINEVDTFSNLKGAYVLSEGNEIIMPASGETSEDIACASAVLAKGIILGGDLNIVRFDLKKYSTPFLALTITYSKTHYDLSKCAQGKSVVHLHNEAISKTAVSIPSLPEQRAIASFFTALDAQITLQRERLEKLKQIKAACLEKMFA